MERAFAHLLDCGGMRRATLRGRQNLNKRFTLAAAFYNLSPLRRKLFGMGTPGQCEALGQSAFGAFLKAWVTRLWVMVVPLLGWEFKPSTEGDYSTWPLRPRENTA